MINDVTISGRLVAEPVAITDKGQRIRLAYGTGQERTPTGFISVTCWNPLGEKVAKLAKGETCTVKGALGFNQWGADDAKRQEITINATDVLVAQPLTDGAA
jgi:single-stranded DNA-binding protein